MNQQRYQYYVAKADEFATRIALLRQKGRYWVLAQLTTFLLAIAFVVVYTLDGASLWWLAGAPVMLAAYVAVRRMDAHNTERLSRLDALRRVYEKESRYQQGDFSCFDDGQRYASPAHPFTFDLDIFGPQSLFQRMCRTVTTGGADALAASLSSVDDRNDRREAIVELAEAEAWRARFMAFGQSKTIETDAIVSVIQEVSRVSMPGWLGSWWALVLACTVLGGFYVSVVLAVAGLIGGSTPFVWGVIQLMVVVGLLSKSLKQATKAAGQLHRQLSAYIGLMDHVMSEPFHSPELLRLRRQLDGDDGSALQSFTLLGNLVRGIDQRGNEMGIVVFNAFGLFDFFLVRRFLRWQQHYLGRIGHWVEAVSQIDMLVSMATYSYNHPEARPALVLDSTAPSATFRARNLRHPFLGTTAVGNDFVVVNRHFYIVTGANMAGKSTFLRSLGINYVLAMQGLPVFADELEVSRFSLFTSMRTTDDLAHGISYFNAELLRLRQLIGSLDDERPTLIILDEILKGTNSLDKLNGSRLFLQTVARRNVTGIVATHDLELSRMADEQPDRFHNYCFEIGLGERVTYSYRITPGVARNQNATFLLKEILKELH